MLPTVRVFLSRQKVQTARFPRCPVQFQEHGAQSRETTVSSAARISRCCSAVSQFPHAHSSVLCPHSLEFSRTLVNREGVYWWKTVPSDRLPLSSFPPLEHVRGACPESAPSLAYLHLGTNFRLWSAFCCTLKLPDFFCFFFKSFKLGPALCQRLCPQEADFETKIRGRRVSGALALARQ